jgi:hypothetical protein
MPFLSTFEEALEQVPSIAKAEANTPPPAS